MEVDADSVSQNKKARTDDGEATQQAIKESQAAEKTAGRSQAKGDVPAVTPAKRKAEAPEVVAAKKRIEDRERAEKAQRAASPPPTAKKSKKKVKSTAELDEEAEEAAERAKFLQIDHGKRKINDTDKQFNQEFNKVSRLYLASLLSVLKISRVQLKIVKPVLTQPAKIVREKEKWRGIEQTGEDEEDNDDWGVGGGASFFVIKTLSASDFKKPEARTDLEADPKWAGKPDYKKFRPVSNRCLGLLIL